MRNVQGRGSRSLTTFDPVKTKAKLNGIRAAIEHATRMQDWPLADEGVDALITEQAAFVAWWDGHVTPSQDVGLNPVVAKRATTRIPVKEASEATGVSKFQVSRWRQRLADVAAYAMWLRKQLFKQAWAKRTREEMHAKDEERVSRLSPIVGKFKTLVIDPPWDYEWLSVAARAKPGYATMTHNDLLDLEVAQWAEDNCHLYLWVTNNFMPRGCELMVRWGFQHKTVLTWVKPHFGLGAHFRNQTEHVLFGIRGQLRTRVDNISTVMYAPLGDHSEKPQVFYDLVQRASHLPAGELFQRTKRDGFVNVFEEA